MTLRVLLVDGSGLPGQRLVRGLGHQHGLSLLDDDPRDRAAQLGRDANVRDRMLVLGLFPLDEVYPLPHLDRG